MKLFKKTLCVLLAALLLGCTALTALADDAETIVCVRVEGITECLYYGVVTVPAGATALDALKAAEAEDETLTLTVTESEGYGAYLLAINGLYAGSQTTKGWDGWMFRVNDEAISVGIDAYVVENGDDVVVYYSDEYGDTGMMYPEINLDDLLEGKVSFTSPVTEYDPETWEPTVTEAPVLGYTLIWDGVRITPDENGVATLTAKQIAEGDHTVQIERYAENGLPSVLRFAPGFTVSICGDDEPTDEPGDGQTDEQDQPQGFFAKLIAFFKNLFRKIANLFGKLLNK